MITINSILKKVTELQTEQGRADLNNPQGRKEFDYGKACGRFEAFETVLESIRSMLEEDKQIEKGK